MNKRLFLCPMSAMTATTFSLPTQATLIDNGCGL